MVHNDFLVAEIPLFIESLASGGSVEERVPLSPPVHIPKYLFINPIINKRRRSPEQPPSRLTLLPTLDFEYAIRVAMKVRPLLLLGDGRSAVEALEIAEAIGDFSLLGFVNSLTRPNPGATIEGLPVFWVDDLPFGPAECEVVCAIVTTERRPFIELMR